MSDYKCALSEMMGESFKGGDDSDGLGDMPVGWTKVTIQRRAYNPKWVFIQQVKQRMLREALAQLPPEMQTETTEQVMVLQIDSQLYGVESETPMFVLEVEEVALSDDLEVVEEFNEVRELLGLSLLEFEDEEPEHEEAVGVPGDDADEDDEGDDDEGED